MKVYIELNMGGGRYECSFLRHNKETGRCRLTYELEMHRPMKGEQIMLAGVVFFVDNILHRGNQLHAIIEIEVNYGGGNWGIKWYEHFENVYENLSNTGWEIQVNTLFTEKTKKEALDLVRREVSPSRWPVDIK